MSYIIRNNELIARTTEYAKAGEIQYAYCKCIESINANKDFTDFTLVNSKYAHISNAKKWGKREKFEEERYFERLDVAIELNDREFYIESEKD